MPAACEEQVNQPVFAGSRANDRSLVADTPQGVNYLHLGATALCVVRGARRPRLRRGLLEGLDRGVACLLGGLEAHRRSA